MNPMHRDVLHDRPVSRSVLAHVKKSVLLLSSKELGLSPLAETIGMALRLISQAFALTRGIGVVKVRGLPTDRLVGSSLSPRHTIERIGKIVPAVARRLA